MHRDHDVFIQGIEQEKRLELVFFSRYPAPGAVQGNHRREVVTLCAPLHYGKGPASPATGAEYELECYYLWDFGAKKGSGFLALSPSQIVSIKLTEVAFHVREFYRLSSQAKKPAKSPNV